MEHFLLKLLIYIRPSSFAECEMTQLNSKGTHPEESDKK